MRFHRHAEPIAGVFVMPITSEGGLFSSLTSHQVPLRCGIKSSVGAGLVQARQARSAIAAAPTWFGIGYLCSPVAIAFRFLAISD